MRDIKGSGLTTTQIVYTAGALVVAYRIYMGGDALMMNGIRGTYKKKDGPSRFDMLRAEVGVIGGYNKDMQVRLEGVIENPNSLTWNNAFDIVLCPGTGGAGITLWQAWLKTDPDAPASRDGHNWPTLPTQEQVITAIQYALTRTAPYSPPWKHPWTVEKANKGGVSSEPIDSADSKTEVG